MGLVVRSFPVMLMAAWVTLAVLSLTSFADFREATAWRTPHRIARHR